MLEEEAATVIPFDGQCPMDAVLVGLAPRQFHYERVMYYYYYYHHVLRLMVIAS
jgi:hypothetical protein